MRRNLVPDALKRNLKSHPPKAHRKTRDVLDLLGCAESHLHSLLRRGRIARPAKDASGDLVWSEADIEAARQALAESRRRKRGKAAKEGKKQ